jgi:adenylate cyclase
VKQNLTRYALGFLILLILLGHSAQIYQLGFVNHLDSIVYDAKVRLTMPQTLDERVVILDIDEKSLAEQGHWPWGRDKLAMVVDKLFEYYGVRLLGFDVVFPEADESSGLNSLEAMARQELRDVPKFQSSLRQLRPKLDYDARFAAALQNRAVILGYYLNRNEGGRNSGVLPAPIFPAGKFDRRGIAFTKWDTFGANLKEFQNAAAGAGHFNPIVDFDGLSRKVPMIAELNGNYYESLSLAMVRTLLGPSEVVAGYPDDAPDVYGNMEWLDIKTAQGGSLRVPVDENAASLIPFRGHRGSFPYYSLTDVLNGRVPQEKLAGRVVLVGTTASGLMDLRATPVDTVYPGVEIHANLIAGMLDGAIKYKPPFIIGADVLLVFVAGMIMAFVLPRLSPFRATILGLIVLLIMLSINMAFWHTGHVVLPLASGLLAVVLLYALNMSWGYFIEARTKRQFAELFGQYVPPELVDEMAKNPEGYSMEGRKEQLTVLFSDVRGFTTISEGLQPDELAELMNEYLGAMTLVVRKHRGTLDKYIGDAIMAFWGAPVRDLAHAKNAVLTALEMQEALLELNKSLVAKGWPELKIGVGVNTGAMTVGDMGSPVRKSYTVMGDAVNLGSRLEGITKQYGVGVIVGEETHSPLQEEFVFRELDRVRVKGKAEPIGIYEPVGIDGQISLDDLKELKLWDQALVAYRSQDWNQAELLLRDLSCIKARYLYALYEKRVEQLRKDPPGEGWDGVTTFETK